MVFVAIVILVIIVVALMFYNYKIHIRLKKFSNIKEHIQSLNIVQEFMNVVGEDISVDEKLKKINEILIKRYDVKYSSIIVFNGAEYVIKATNVDEKHWETLKNLHTEEIFKDSITSTTPKYISVEKEGERLPYQKMEFERAKSAMFFPLFIENIYIGYWIIESGEMHAFDSFDTTILEVVKENLVAILRTVSYQNTIENIVRKDEFSGLNSAEYLYGIGKKTIDKYPVSTVCMFKVINLKEINENISRKAGNNTIIEVSNTVKKGIASEYIFVRYMGPKFVIVFSGVESNAVADFINDIKQNVEKLKIEAILQSKGKKKQIFVEPKLNFAVSNYYKGTGIEEVTKKLEEYLDTAEEDESDINYI